MLGRVYHAVTAYVTGMVDSHKKRSTMSRVRSIDSELGKIRATEIFRPDSQLRGYSVYSDFDIENRRRQLAVERELLVRQNPELLMDED